MKSKNKIRSTWNKLCDFSQYNHFGVVFLKIFFKITFYEMETDSFFIEII